MPITDHSKDKLLKRLARASGHLDAVQRMVDEKRYCIDVLHQLKAVQSALDKVSEEILKQHIETCVVDAIRNQDEQRVVDELIEVFRKAPGLELTPADFSRLEKPQATSGNGKKDCCPSK